MKFNFSVILIFLSLQSFAQKSQVQIARNSLGKLQAAMRENKSVKDQLTILGEGIKAAENASADRRTKRWPETWAMKAYFTSYLSIIESDPQRSEDSYVKSLILLDTAKLLNRYDENLELIDATSLNIIIKKQDKGNKAYAANDFNGAFNLLKDVSDFFPQDSTLAINAALSAQNIRNYDQALQYFKRAKDNGARNPIVFQNLANLYASKFESELAIRTFEDGLKVNPLNVYLINDYINLLLDNNHYDKADKTIEDVLKFDKDNKLLYFLYGYLQQIKANNMKAEAAYRSALQLDQTYFPALYQLALTYIDISTAELKSRNVEGFISRINESAEILEHAHELNPNDTRTIQLLLEIYSRKGRLDKVQEFRRILEQL
jgi:tetratricopeptide (TPR) repeat protein